MKRIINRTLHLRKTTYLTYGIILAVSFLVGFIFWYFLADTEAGDVMDMMNLVGIIFAYGACLVMAFFHSMLYSVEMSRGLQFGSTRRELFIGYRLTDIPLLLVFVLMAFICGGKDLFLVIIEGILVMLFFYHLTQAIVGNMILRFGKIAYWIYYFFILLLILAIPRVLSSMTGAMDKVVDFYMAVATNSAGVICGLVVANLVALFVNWLFLRKTPCNVMS